MSQSPNRVRSASPVRVMRGEAGPVRRREYQEQMRVVRIEAAAPPLEPISPELALVCDELRARAIAALPERPWELFAVPAAWSPEPEAAPADEAVQPTKRRLLRNLVFAPVAAAGFVFAVLWFGSDHPASPAPAAAVTPLQGIAAARNLGPIGDVHAGGYVFDGGVLQLGADGTTVRALSFTAGCAKGGAVE